MIAHEGDVPLQGVNTWRIYGGGCNNLIYSLRLNKSWVENLSVTLSCVVLLAVLRVGEDAYGVPISREIEDRTGREVVLGSVYAALERLEGKGLVCSKLGEPTPERGGRAKAYFRVTAKGLREVRQAQRTLVKLWRGIPELEGGVT